MNEFDKVIGYESIKNELLQICDMIKNKEAYDTIGARLPQGALLYGYPGLGKTLMAKCFINESGLNAYTLRRNKSCVDFIESITRIFDKAKQEGNCIIFLDDLDKFANEDAEHVDAEEYVAVQAGIDEIKGCNVFVIATANDINKLPRSLLRSGRFDRVIEVQRPTNKDAREIISYYLTDKRVSKDVNMDDLSRMVSYSSCAELETILNEAAINAAFNRRESVEMDDFVKSVLRMQYECPDTYEKTSLEDMKVTALHEAGHIVVAEILCPESIGLASVRVDGRSETAGFVHRCKALKRRPYHALVSLAGKAAVELYYSETVASGCQDDIMQALRVIRSGIIDNATHGLSLVEIGPPIRRESSGDTEINDAITHAELERYMMKVKDILIKNRDFLEKTADALAEKETLFYSDIQAIKKNTTIVNVTV